MTRYLTSAVLAAALLLAPVAVPPAAAQSTGNPNELAQVLGGLAAIGVLGFAIKKARDRDDDRSDRRVDRSERWDDRHGYRDGRRDRWDDRHREERRHRGRYRDGHDRREYRGRRGTASACLRWIETRRGPAQIYDRHCLQRMGLTVARRN